MDESTKFSVSKEQDRLGLKSLFLRGEYMQENLLAVIIIATAMLIVSIRLKRGKPLK